MIKVEGHSNLIREESSQAIINTDVEQFKLVMRRRQIIASQKKEINSLRQEVTEVKELLRKIEEKING